MNLEELKEELIKIFRTEIDIIKSIQREFSAIREENLLFAPFQTNVDEMLNNLEDNLKRMDRSKMKCVTFGNTSNGKSSILNALLEIDAFPSGYGRATSCFASVQGCEEEDGYVRDKNNQKQDLELIKQLTDANCDGHYDINSELKVFLPQSECEILKEDVEIWDSPGVDYSEEHNEIINEHCRDADVFLLVINGCSTLSLTERQLFGTISKIITIPSIIFLINKWDKIETNLREKVKQQHLKKITKYFVLNLKIYKSQKEIEERIFFVSARDEGLQDEHGVIFDRFKKKLIDELRINATRRKLKGNVELVLRYSQESSVILEKIKHFVDDTQKEEGLRESLQKSIDETVEGIEKKFNDLVKKMSLKLAEDIQIQMMKNISLDSLHNAASIIEPMKNEMGNCYREQISERCQQSLNATKIHEYFQLFAKFNDMVQCFADIRESLFVEFLENLEIIFSDKKCVEDDLSLTTISMMIQIKGFIKDFCVQNNPGWIKKIKNLKMSEIPRLTFSKVGSFFTSSEKSIEPLKETDKPEIIENECQTGEELDSKSTQDTKSMVDMLTSLRKKLKEIVTENKKEKEKVANIFKGIADNLESNLKMLMETHVKLTRSEIEENIKKCVDKYFRDQLEILEMWKRLEVKIFDRKEIADLKNKIDEC